MLFLLFYIHILISVNIYTEAVIVTVGAVMVMCTATVRNWIWS